MSNFLCIDCKRDTLDEYYMVSDNIWAEAHMETHGGMLCIGCLEKRLRRKLGPSDFPDYPINTLKISRSARLRDRLKA
jgi:hypothetical protein